MTGYTKQDLREAYDKGYSQGCNEGEESYKEELKEKDMKDNWYEYIDDYWDGDSNVIQ